MTDKNPEVAIVMGSDSDLPVMKGAAEILDQFDIAYDLTIVSAHRTPDKLYDFADKAASNGYKVVIAGAGGAAHLPGMIASITPLPVIGVPVKSKAMNGVDSLYSIVQMPAGVPVATVAINGATNAGILAAQIVASNDAETLETIRKYKAELKASVEAKAEKLEAQGYADYLQAKEESQ